MTSLDIGCQSESKRCFRHFDTDCQTRRTCLRVITNWLPIGVHCPPRMSFKADVESLVDSFALGCVAGGRFVSHMRSGHYPKLIMAFFDNCRKKVAIRLLTARAQNYELCLKYSDIRSIAISDNKMVIRCKYPPLLHEWLNDQGKPAVDFTSASPTFRVRVARMTLEDDQGDVKLVSQELSKTNCLHIQFKDMQPLDDIVHSIGLIEPSVTVSRDESNKLFDVEEVELNETPIASLDDMPFAIRYSLESLTNISYQLTDALNVFGHSYKEFVDLVKRMADDNEKATEDSLNDLRQLIESNSDMNPVEDLNRKFINYKEQPLKKWVNKSVILVRRCVLTPTRLVLLPSLPLQESRFLRIADPDYVIRLLIKDEDMQTLSFTVGKTSLPAEHPVVNHVNQFLSDTIVEQLRSGIDIAGRTYQVLGASTSQLRDHGLVLYARDQQNRSAEDIVDLIGNLKHFRNPAKFVARIGQSMSQSMGYEKIDKCDVELIDDITGGIHEITKDQFVFSDGVGKISPQMAERLCDSLNIKPVSTFQIRYGGFKGILVVDPNLGGHKILLRPRSMKKFESNSDEIDVLKVSAPRKCYLNRPLIMILNELSVKSEVFVELLYHRHRQLVTAFDCDCKAIDTMRDYSAIDFDFKGLLKSGISVLNEPFFVDIVQSINRKVSLDLKNKARILIPYDSARVMYGVLDETNTLEYGQVFVQYTHSTGHKEVLTGVVLVTKYPCMHPGDVRKLTAVDVPELRHICDSIVFPQRGDRPHPDEMAGSDLDGDEFSVIWYQPLIFEGHNYSPMWFPSGQTTELDHTITTEDLLRFYCGFIVDNQIGLLASSHLAWADYNGLYTRRCFHLADKYAVALDYAKTGLNERLRNDDKPKQYPDFMMKDNEKPTYRSDKALGLLYRKNCYFMQLMEDFWSLDIKFEINPKLIDPNADKYMAEARKLFAVYKASVKDLMYRFGIDSESALMSVTFNKTNAYLKSDSNDTFELVTNIVKHLISDFLKRFEDEVDPSERPAKASAWYQVSHELNRDQSQTFYGFGWIAVKYLVELATSNGSKRHICQSDATNSCKELTELVDNKFIIAMFSHIVTTYLKKYTDVAIGSLTFKDFLAKKVIEVIDELKSSDGKIPLNAMSAVFRRLSDVTDLNVRDEYELAVTSMMASLKCRRLGLKLGLIRLMQSPPIVHGDKHYALVIPIKEQLADMIAEDRDIILEEIQEKVGVRPIDMKPGLKGHESFIYVVGNRNARHKVKYFFSDKNLHGIVKSMIPYRKPENPI